MKRYPDGKNYKVILFLPEEVQSAWDQLGPVFARGLDQLEFLPEDLLFLATMNDVQLWAMYERDVPVLVMATRFIHYPRRRVMHILALAGQKLQYAQRFWPKVVEFMRLNECVAVSAFAGGQMSRVMQRRFDFVKRYDYLERSFVGGLH